MLTKRVEHFRVLRALTKKHDRFQQVLESEAVYLVLNPSGSLSDPVAVQAERKEIHKAAMIER